MATISLTEIAQLTKKAIDIVAALASAPADLRKAQVKVTALKTYLSAIQRETRNPKATINVNKSVRRDAELLLGFCMAALEEVYAISVKYEGKGTGGGGGGGMGLGMKLKWISGDQKAWAEALVTLEELRMELRQYLRDVCIGVIGCNAVEAALDDTDDEAKAVDAAISKKTKKNPRPVSQEERNDLLTFAQAVKAQRPKPSKDAAKPKLPPTARLECWVCKTTASPSGVTKTWKQEKRAQASLRQMAKDLKGSANAKNINSHADERVQWLLNHKNGAEKKEAKVKWVFVAGRVVQRGFVGFVPSETAMVIVRRNLPKDVEKPVKEKKGGDGKLAPSGKGAKGDGKATPPNKSPLGDCRYGSSCTTLDCKYKHPKRGPCRYGEECANEKCGFEHSARQCRFKVCRKAGCTFKHRAGQRGAVKTANSTV